jgi:hypothetical protein
MKRIGEDVAEKLDYTPAPSASSATSAASGSVPVRNPGAGPGARPRDRQGHPHHRAAGPGAGGQVSGSSAAVPPGRHLRPGGARDSPIHARPVGRPDGRAASAAGRCPEGELLAFPVLHADETPVAMLDPGPARPTGPTCGPTASAPTIRSGR